MHLKHMPPLGCFFRLDAGGQRNMCLLPTRGCHGELARHRGPRLEEDSRSPLAEAYSARIRHPGQVVDRPLRFYIPPRRVFLVEEVRLPAQVLVVVCQEEGLLCDGLPGECLRHMFQIESCGLHLGV